MATTAQPIELFGPRELADRLGVQFGRVKHLLDAKRVQFVPAKIVSGRRLYTADMLEPLRAELRVQELRREGRR